jgi:hypothetical protein
MFFLEAVEYRRNNFMYIKTYFVIFNILGIFAGLKKRNMHASQFHPEQKVQKFTVKSAMPMFFFIREGTESDVCMMGNQLFEL